LQNSGLYRNFDMVKKIFSQVSISKLVSINDKPDRIARGFALGSFVGMMPIPGFQLIVSLFMATILKINSKAACLGVFNTNVFTGAFVFMFNFWIGQKILGISPEFTFPEKIGISFLKTILAAGSDVFLCMLTGGIIIGTLSAIIGYYIIRRLLARLNKNSLKIQYYGNKC
jgi:uncharacterized protein